MRRIAYIIPLLLVSGVIYGQFLAVHIPDDKIEKIKIDGDTSDWDWMPEKYVISENYMGFAFDNSLKDNNSWRCRIKVGWSDVTNKIYVNAKIIDDIIVLSNPVHYMNDCFQLAVNANNNGGEFTGENSPNHVVVGWCNLDTANGTNFNLAVGPQWMFDTLSDIVKWKVVNYKDNSKKNVIIYEMSLSLFDKWENDSPEKSNLCLLAPGKDLKLTLIFEDVDRMDNSRTEWTSKVSWEWYMDADYFSQFTLSPPLPKKGISWQNINYVLNP